MAKLQSVEPNIADLVNGWLKKYYLWVDQFLKDNPDYQYSKPSRVKYLVQEVGDGDVLLKIACELFVD